MNSRQIIFDNLNHCGTRPGMNFHNGRMNDIANVWPGPPSSYQPRRWTEGDYEYYDDMWGNLWKRISDGCSIGEIDTPAIADWDQLNSFAPPEYDYDELVNFLKENFSSAGDKFRLMGMPGWIFASSRYLRKMENYLMDMLLYPEELKILHEKMGTFFEQFIHAAAEAGADAIFFAEDMGTQNGLLFSPELWHEYFADLYSRLFSLAHEKGLKVFMHSCGQNRKIIEPLLKAGVDCFQFDQPAVYDPEDLAGLLKQYKAALWSPVDIQKILPTGNRELIEKGVDDMLQHFNGFLIFKNYPDLAGIGIKEEWDQWAYLRILSQIDTAVNN